MERLHASVEGVLASLWGLDVSVELHSSSTTTRQADFEALLDRIVHHATARKIAFRNETGPDKKKQLRKEPTDGDLVSAEAFLKRVFSPKNVNSPKWSHFRGLGYRPLAISALLFRGRNVIDHTSQTAQALSEGASRIAEWSPWPNDQKLSSLLLRYGCKQGKFFLLLAGVLCQSRAVLI
jgi:hypothetical protein